MNRKLLGLVLFLLFVNQIVWGQCPPNASVSLGSNQFYCSNTNVTLVPTINNAPSGSPTYSWTGPNISGQSGTTLTVPVNQSGTYSVSIDYGNNCVLTDQVVVTFLPVPTITPSQCIASGASANLSVNINPALPITITPTYLWTGPNGFTSSSPNPTISPFNSINAGTYNVTVSFNPSSGASCVYPLSTILNLNPTTPTFSIPSNGCLNTNYSPTGFSAQPNTTYSWTVTPSSSSTGLNGPTPVFNFTNSGTYSISVTATLNGCTATSSSQGISIPNFSLAAPTIEANSNYYNVTTTNPNTIAICAGSNLSSIIIINNSSATYGGLNPAGTTYTYSLNGSAASSIIDNVNQTINYGNNNLILTANYLGCTITGTYNVYSGSNPYVLFGTGNSTGICPGNSISFDINPINPSGQLNPPGTTYTVTFSDTPGTSTVLTDITTLTSVNHTFNTTSCGATNPSTFPANTFYAQVVVQNFCGQTNPSVSPITVNNFPTANFTVTDSTICAGQSITVTNTGTAGTIVGNAPPYNCSNQGKFYWVISGGTSGVDYNLVSGVLGSYNSSYTLPNGNPNLAGNGSNTLEITFNNPGYYTITQYYYNSCGIKSKVRNICVINPPTCQFTVSPNSGCSPLTVNINNTTVAPTCGGTPVPLTYTWTVTSPTGTSASYTSNTSQVPPALTLTNPTSTPQTFTISLVVNPKDPYNTSQNFGNPNCISNCTQTVTVNPIPIFTPFNLTSCVSPYQANVNLQSSTNMTSTFSWVATPNANVIGESTTNQSSSIINDNLTNQSSTFQTITYSITPTSSLGCIGATQNSTISINTIVPGTISANQTICSGGDPQTLTGSAPSGLGTLTYQWQSSIDNVSWSNIANATSASYDPPPTTSTIYYRRVVSYLSNGVTCSSNSNVVTITVNNINPGTIGAPQNICAGDDPVALSVVTSATGAGTLSNTWQSSTTSATSGFSNIPNQTGTSYDPPIITTTTWYQLNVTSTLNGITCSQNTPAIAISVFNLNPGVVGSNQNICEGGDPSNITETTPASTSTGTLSYQWQSSIDNVSWTNISGATGSTFNPPILNSTTYYRRIVYVYSGSTLICQGYSNVVSIQVLPDPTVTNPTSQTICTGGSPAPISVSASGGINSNYTYQWYNASGLISGATQSTYTPSSSTGSYYCVVSIIPTTTTGCSVTSANATVTVEPDPIVTAPQSATYCQNASTVTPLSVTASGGISTAYAYQWYSNTSNNTTSGIAIAAASGGTSASYTPSVNNTGTLYYYCVVSINPTSTGCSVTSAIATITVNSGPSISSQPQSQTICVGGTLNDLSVSYSGGSGNVTYQWYSNLTNSTSGGTPVGTSSSSYTLPATINSSIGTSYYYCQLSFGGSGGCSQISTVVATISVLADPIFSVQPNPTQTICASGTLASPLSATVTGGSGTNTYQWYTVNGSTYTPIANSNSSTYNPTAFANAGTFNYAVSVTQSVSGCASSNSNIAEVVVVPDPTVSITTGASYCQNANPVTPLSVTATGGASVNYSYQWFNGSSQITGATSNTYTPSVATTGTSNYTCQVTISPAAIGCSTTSNQATITVTSGPTFTSQPQSQTICVGGTLNALSVTYSGGSGTASYQWYSNTTNANTGGILLQGETNASFTLPSTLNSTAANSYYYCVISFGSGSGCSVITSNVATISVLADPIFSVQPNPTQTICAGGTLASPLSATVTGGSGTNTYQWYTVNGSTYTPIANSNSSSYNPTAFANAGTFNYAVSVTQSASGCASANSNIAEVVVVPDPTVSITTGASYCQNASPVAPLSVSVIGGNGSAYTYQWYTNTTNSNSGGNPLPNSNNASFTPPVSSTGTLYYYCLVTNSPISSGCSTSSGTATITVTSGPTFTSQPQSQTICVGGTLSALSVAYSGGSGTASYQWYSNTTNANTGGTLLPGETNASFTLPSTLNSTAANSYYYCVISFGTGSGCSVITSNVATISVLADPTFSVQPNPTQTICVGGTLASPLSATITGGSGTITYQWYTVIGANYTPIANSNSSSYNPTAFTNAGTFNYAVSVTQSVSGCGSANSNNAEVIVVADPAVSITAGASYCQNASPVTPLSVTATGGASSNYSYQWFNGTNQITGATSNTYTPSVAATGSINYTCQVTISPAAIGCSTTSNQATIVVNAAPTFSSQPQSQTICVGGTLSDLTVAYSGGTGTVTYQWYSNTTNTTSGGIAVGTSSSSYTLPSTLNTSVGTSYYYCQLSFGGSGGCSQITSTVATINVVADPTVIAPTSQTICTGGSPAPISVSASGGINSNYSYQWFNASGSISGATLNSYTPPSSAGTYYCVVSILPTTTGCSVSSINGTITIEPDPTVSAPQSASYCQNASTVTPLSVTTTGGNGSTYTYQWYTNTTNSNSGGNPLPNSNNASFTPPVSSTGTLYYYCLVTNSPASSGCSAASGTAAITVNSAPTFSTPSLPTQTICLDGTFNALTVATQNGTGTPTFQWYSNSNNSTSNGTLLSGETNNSYTPPSNVIGTVYYYCIATFASGGCSSITSTIGVANVVADPIISIEPIPNQSICVGGTIGTPLTATATGGTGNTSYQWSNSSGPITGETNQNFTPLSFSTVGTYSYFVTISLSGSGCNSVVSQNAQIEVVADPTVSTQPISAEYCQNASPVSALTVSATGGIGTFSYQWYSNINNSSTGGTLIPSATNSSYTPPVNTIGVKYYYCIISQTGLNCSVTSAVAAITVNAAPTFSTPALPTQTICLDGTFNALTVATQNGTGTPTYQWFSNTVNSTSNGTLISGATNSSFTPPSNVVGTTYYYCVATFASGGCSSITSTVATSIVVADPVISAQPIASQSICVGGTIATALTAASTGGTGTTSYQWSNASGPITGATNQTYLPPNFATVGQYLYSVTITLSGSGCNALTTQNALIDVIADPIVSTQPISASYCQNGSPVAPLTISASGGVNSNYIYQWFNGTSLISGATSNSYIPSVAATGTINYTCQVSIDPSAIGCTVTSNAATIQVNPAPTFSTPALPTQTVCLDGTFNALTVATQNGTGSPTYQWFSNNANSTSNGTPITGATSSSYTPPSNVVGTTYYYCVSTFASGGCSAITSTVATAIVVADPVISSQPIASQSICVGGTIATALTAAATGGTGTTSYQWSNASGPIAGATNQTYLPPSFTTVGQYSYSVTITLSGSGCNALTTQNGLIEVVADPIVDTQPVSASYCQNGSPVAPLTVTATGGIGTYLYQWYSNTSNSNSGGVLIPGATNSSFTPSVSAIGTTYYYCSITQTGLNCNVTSNTAAIIVNQAPAFIDQPLSQTICIGGTFTPLSVTYQYGTGIPIYQWYSNSVNSYTGAVAITGATNPSYQPDASSVSNIYYFCQISFSFGGCTSISSLISNQIVVDDPIITSQPLNNQTICVGGTIPSSLIVNVSGGTGTTTYQWYAGSNAISGATQNSFVPSIYNNPGIYDYTVNISSSGVGCAALTSQVATVEVLADPLISAPLAATYCQNASPITALQVTVSGGAGTNTYQWYASATNTTTAGTPVSNATTSSYTPPVNTVGIVYYYCIVTQSTPNCANTSLNAPIQVNLPPTISVQPISTQTLCEGGSPTPLQIAYINGTNSATYQWYSNNVNSNTGGTPLLNETNPIYTPPSILTGTVFYYCVITFQQGGCSSITSISSQVTIVNDPAISLQPLAAQEICQGNTINSPLTFNYTGGTGNSTIAWYLDVNPPILINGITTNSYLPIPFNVADSFNYYATLTFDGVGCNVATTQLASIIVHPTPYVTNLDDTLVLCNNGVLDIPLTASVTSTFQWDTPQTSSVNGESFLTQTSYSIDDSLTNTTTVPQFLTYSVTPTSFPYGCVGPDSTVVIQVQPDVILSMNQAIEICSGSPVNGILTSNIPSTFNWFVSIDNPNVTGESILPSTNWLVNDVLVNTSTVNQVVVYSVFPVSIQGSCPGLAQPLVVTVKPPIDILNPDTLTICSGSNVGINLVANTNVQFNWYASPSLNVLNETTSVVSSSIINDQLVNPTNAVEIVTYYVIGTSTANGCSSPVLPLYVVVNPIPSLVNLNPLTICNGNYLYPYSLQTSVTGATTNWSVLNNPIGIPSSFGSNTLPGFIATNNTIVTQTGQILITPIFTNNNVTCIGLDTTLLIPVLPTPSVNTISDIIICNLTQVPLTPVTGPVPNSYFEWMNSNIATGLNATGIGDIPIFVGLNPGTAPLSGTVSVTPYYTQNNVTCQGTPIDFDITVNPSPVLINNDIEICDQEFTNILLNANISSSFIWNAQIQPNVYNETAAPIQTSALINDQLVLATTTQQTVTYNVTPISTPYGCFGNDTTIEVIVHPLPVVDFTVLTPILCDQAQINFQNNSVGSLDYTWTFGDGDSSFLFNPVHEYANFGSYLVQLEAIDQITGCFNQDSQVLTINESPEADFILSDSIACGSLDVVFNALDLNPNWTYLWTFGDGTSSNQYGLAGHQYVTNGCFDVTLQISTPQGCVSDTTQLDAVCIYPEPIAAFTMDDPVISSLTPEVQFFNSSLYANTYFWDFGDGTTSITENPYHLFPSDPATYVIVLTASNQIGCMDTAALTVTVWQDLAIYVPNTFTPDDDDHNQTFKPILTEGFKKDSYHLMIFNRWGEVVFESEDYNIGWDGSYADKAYKSQDGTYTWKIEITELQSGETRRFLGHVNLIR